MGGHCLVGSEKVVVRSTEDGSERVAPLDQLFSEQLSIERSCNLTAAGGDVIYRPRLEALSIDTESQQPQWKPVHYLFRRKYDGAIVTITTSGNRRLTVTDKHPMLVSDERGRLQQVFAKDLVIGNLLPAQQMAAAVKVGSENYRFEFHQKPVTVPVKSVKIEMASSAIDVYSLEVADTHTFATSCGIYVHNCIPLDPHYLSWKARLHGFEARFISLAEEVNSHMPRHVVQLAQDGLNEQGKPLKGSRVLVLGVAYKRDIDDVRESPALGIVDQLLHKGAQVIYHDPYIKEMDLDGKGKLESTPLTDETIASLDCAVIVTDHSNVDYARVVRLAPLIIDTRNITRKLGMPEFESKIIRL
ncbi:MAG TPA: UDP binding domain-containing protein [Blastocatellia bacterium]|nr:UDP binding domain-containing protein [Blastocatellia bacterium]